MGHTFGKYLMFVCQCISPLHRIEVGRATNARLLKVWRDVKSVLIFPVIIICSVPLI